MTRSDPGRGQPLPRPEDRGTDAGDAARSDWSDAAGRGDDEDRPGTFGPARLGETGRTRLGVLAVTTWGGRGNDLGGSR
jgi:hypothetical protein